jgi:DNA-binding transcriptional regulator YhcF (GntR family)
MMLRVDSDSAVPVYEQLRAQIATMVAAGTLARGAQLPTIRQLAHDLGIAKGTVSKAYETLLHSGIIVSKGRHGTVVAPAPVALSRAERDRQLADAATVYAVSVAQLGIDVDAAHRQLDAAVHRLDRTRNG